VTIAVLCIVDTSKGNRDHWNLGIADRAGCGRRDASKDSHLNIFEILLLLALALIVVGPERLPEVLQMVGKVLRELRMASNTVMRELTEVTEEPRRTLRELDPFQTGDSQVMKPKDQPATPPPPPPSTKP
jgi:sec-independent protein translocase protein TatA